MKKEKKNICVRLIICFVALLLAMSLTFYFFYTSLIEGEKVEISYKEDANLEYKILLKENEFYEDSYLNEDYNIVANSIDKVNVSFDYQLHTSDFVKGSSYFIINSKIIAYQDSDDSQRKVWDYNKKIKDKTTTVFDEKVKVMPLSGEFEVDYNFYKKLMEDYKKQYTVSLTGDLIIDIELKTDVDYEYFADKKELGKKKMTLSIPLTESIIEIKKDIPVFEEQLIVEKQDSKISYVKVAFGLVSLIFVIILLYMLIKLLIRVFGIDSKYIKELKKILRTYNYVIVDVKKIDLKKESNVIYVKSFEELLDAQSELRVPILYSNVRHNKEDIFVIKYNSDLLVYRMTSDLYPENK